MLSLSKNPFPLLCSRVRFPPCWGAFVIRIGTAHQPFYIVGNGDESSVGLHMALQRSCSAQERELSIYRHKAGFEVRSFPVEVGDARSDDVEAGRFMGLRAYRVNISVSMEPADTLNQKIYRCKI
ncbi:hypothetical protein CFAL_01950 [Corynebacterium falsenii DSM 44353]|nr:hypothetical protein CFAL_01950 [Corynebacterium falsenii DSM 44353]